MGINLFMCFQIFVTYLWQALIFNIGHDSVLKQAMKNRKTPPEALGCYYGG